MAVVTTSLLEIFDVVFLHLRLLLSSILYAGTYLSSSNTYDNLSMPQIHFSSRSYIPEILLLILVADLCVLSILYITLSVVQASNFCHQYKLVFILLIIDGAVCVLWAGMLQVCNSLVFQCFHSLERELLLLLLVSPVFDPP